MTQSNRHRGFGHVFENRAVLREMLRLYQDGQGASALARVYHCDHSSILFQVKKNGITPHGNLYKKPSPLPLTKLKIRPLIIIPTPLVLPIPRVPQLDPIHFDVTGDRINQGKNYAQYKREANRLKRFRDNYPQR